MEIYERDQPPAQGFLFPCALRINGQRVYTPAGTRYVVEGGAPPDALVLRLTVMPTSLKFLPGPAPDSAEAEVRP